MIWLASYPRSGNTFFRIVLDEVYGIESSTFHRDPQREPEPDYMDYPVVKTHLLPSQLVPDDPSIPAVYLVRDGRDALISMAHQRKDIIEPGTDFEANLREAILAAEGSYFGGWSRNVLEWLERAALVIKFEELIEHPIECMERLHPLIALPPPRVDRLPSFDDLKDKPMKYGSGVESGYASKELARRRTLFFRRGKPGAWRDEMPPDLHRLFWEHHGDAMRALGYLDGEIKTRSWSYRLRKRVRGF